MRQFRVGLYSVILLSVAVMLQPCFAQTSSLGNTSKSDDITVQQNGDIFPLLKIAECNLDGLIFQSGDLSIKNFRSHLSIQGRDLSGNKWEAHTSITGLGCEIYRGDLDGNGKSDLAVWIPGIGSRGSYETRLVVLLFDATGKPAPWGATGKFSATTNGIAEIRRGAGGGAVIMHNYMTGHPAWDGVTYLSKPYKVADAGITSIDGRYSGIEFPSVTGARAADPAFQKAMRRMSLSTMNGSQNTTVDSLSSLPRIVRYGADARAVAKPQNTAPITAEQGARLTIDVDALNATTEHIILSDGSKLNMPTILIVDSSGGRRTITFDPESDDFTQLEKGSYRINQTGTDCTDADDCRPFILRAIEENPQQ